MLAESRQLAQWDEESRLRGARREGWQEGRMEGWQEGQLEGWQKGQLEGWQKGQLEGMFAVARKALSENMPLPTIQILTGLSQDEIMALSFEGQRKH